VRFVFLSDTHLLHEKLTVPECDVLVHAGDYSNRGFTDDLKDFLVWFTRQPGEHKVLVPGNHDFCCERTPAMAKELCEKAGVRYLVDEGCEVGGFKLWGSPWTPRFGAWAFMKDRGADIGERWALIPKGLDVLVTHGPPMGLGDMTKRGEPVGCEALLARVLKVKPRLHVFGHIHEGAGEHRLPDVATRFINVASTPMPPVRVHPAVVVDLDPRLKR
jgi:Icc-related predicted phosphoesterase